MQHHFLTLFENIPEETLRWEKIILLWKKNLIIPEGEMVNRFAIGTIRVLYNHDLFTKPGF
jgi:hypothetical protein